MSDNVKSVEETEAANLWNQLSKAEKDGVKGISPKETKEFMASLKPLDRAKLKTKLDFLELEKENAPITKESIKKAMDTPVAWADINIAVFIAAGQGTHDWPRFFRGHDIIMNDQDKNGTTTRGELLPALMNKQLLEQSRAR